MAHSIDEGHHVDLDDFDVTSMGGLPQQYRIKITIDPKGNYDEMGLSLKATDKQHNDFKVALNTNK